MRNKLGFIAPLSALVGLAMAAAISTPAAAATNSDKNVTPATVSATHVSARRHSHRNYHRSYAYRHSYAPWPFSWHHGRVANPNYGPGTSQYRQALRQGRCVMDEGYGRYTACSNN